MALFKDKGKEDEMERAESLARSFSDLRKMYAGRHLESEIVRYISQAQKDEDAVGIRDLTSNEIAFYRGIRTGLIRLQKEIDRASKGIV